MECLTGTLVRYLVYRSYNSTAAATASVTTTTTASIDASLALSETKARCSTGLRLRREPPFPSYHSALFAQQRLCHASSSTDLPPPFNLTTEDQDDEGGGDDVKRKAPSILAQLLQRHGRVGSADGVALKHSPQHVSTAAAKRSSFTPTPPNDQNSATRTGVTHDRHLVDTLGDPPQQPPGPSEIANTASSQLTEVAQQERQEYVPLLYRADFMKTWRIPHRPLPIDQLESTVQVIPPPNIATLGSARLSERDDEADTFAEGFRERAATMGDLASGDAVSGRRAPVPTAGVTDPLSFSSSADAVQSVDGNLSCEGGGSAARDDDGRVLYTVTAMPTTSKIILDPVQWLAQAPDAPLMEQETLFANIAPTARELVFTESTYRPRYKNAGEDNEDVPSSGDSLLSTAGSDTVTGQTVEESVVTPVDALSAAVPAMEDVSSVTASPREDTFSVSGEVESSETVGVPTADAPSVAPLRASASQTGSITASSDVLSALPPHTRAVREESGSTGLAGSEFVPFDEKHAPSAQVGMGSRLVFNIFTQRVARATSPAVQSLTLLGIHVDETTRQLALQDPDALHAFAKKLKNNQVTWPSMWSHSGQYRQLESLLSDRRCNNAAARVEELLATEYRRHQTRHRVGVIASATGAQCGRSRNEGGSADSVQQAASTELSSLIQDAGNELFSFEDLNEEQIKVVELIMRGYNTYIGGSAGTGKSVLLRVLVKVLHKQRLKVAVTATTGVAASLIGGSTLHHRLGISVDGEFTRPKELASYDVLIIDEVSMLSRELLESVERKMRRQNGVDLPFGGVQVILCGDFLQLGAIASQPIVNAPVFRRNFAMVKLQTPVRQAANPVFAAQLKQLRHGLVPPGLRESLNSITAAGATTTGYEDSALHRRKQEQQLVDALGDDELDRLASEANAHTGDNGPAMATSYVEGAVNLLPTNEEVRRVNDRELAKLPGDPITFMPQFLPPDLCGRWSPTYLLRIDNPRRLDSCKLTLELKLFIQEAFAKLEGSTKTKPSAMDQNRLDLYPLFADALALRVQLPLGMEDEQLQGFTRYMNKELDGFLGGLDLGVHVREVLTSSTGLQTERDDYILNLYAQASPMASPVTLKLGARVMLRANLATGLVNGSLGTVVDFCALDPNLVPNFLLTTAQQEDTFSTYSEFLEYEHGFQTPVMPVVKFASGQVVPIPPTRSSVGGTSSTHHYSLGINAFPLSLAYAFTVHKVQGLTLVGRVHLELSRMWPCDHLLYVAMSRVRNPEQLSISNFHNRLVQANADCLLFDSSLPSIGNVRPPAHLVPATWRRSPSLRKMSLLTKTLTTLAGKKRRAQRERQKKRRDTLEGEIRALQAQFLDGAIPKHQK